MWTVQIILWKSTRTSNIFKKLALISLKELIITYTYRQVFWSWISSSMQHPLCDVLAENTFSSANNSTMNYGWRIGNVLRSMPVLAIQPCWFHRLHHHAYSWESFHGDVPGSKEGSTSLDLICDAYNTPPCSQQLTTACCILGHADTSNWRFPTMDTNLCWWFRWIEPTKDRVPYTPPGFHVLMLYALNNSDHHIKNTASPPAPNKSHIKQIQTQGAVLLQQTIKTSLPMFSLVHKWSKGSWHFTNGWLSLCKRSQIWALDLNKQISIFISL